MSDSMKLPNESWYDHWLDLIEGDNLRDHHVQSILYSLASGDISPGQYKTLKDLSPIIQTHEGRAAPKREKATGVAEEDHRRHPNCDRHPVCDRN